jgi:hypothetical protein
MGVLERLGHRIKNTIYSNKKVVYYVVLEVHFKYDKCSRKEGS